MAEKLISNRQKKTIAALLTTRNIHEAARQASVGERTIYRWMGEPVFRTALLEAEGTAIDAATRRLISLQDEAIDTFHAVLKDPESVPAVRLRAAQSILDVLLKFRDLRDIEIRISTLEKVIHEQISEA